LNKKNIAVAISAAALACFVSDCIAQAIPPMNSVTRKPITVLADPGTPSTPAGDANPAVPASVATPAENFRLWIFDPRNPSVALGSPGIFIQQGTGAFSFVNARADGSLSQSLQPGTYNFDVVEPSSLSGSMVRKRYVATVTASSISVAGRTADSRGFFAVTVSSFSAAQSQAMSAYSALTAQSSLAYNPRSSCQLIDSTGARSSVSSLTAGFPRVTSRLRNYGTIKALIVPVDFADQPGTDNPATFFQAVADGTRDFYYSQSYGRVAFDFYVLPKWMRMPFSSTKYALAASTSNHDGYRAEIIASTDSIIDYAAYDAVYFLMPKETPNSTAVAGPAIAAPILVRNGVISSGASGGNDMYNVPVPGAQWRWMSHETGHSFGLYDEDQDHQSQTLGSWGIMANNWSPEVIEHGAWDRYLLGWLDEAQVLCLPKPALDTAGTTIKLSPLVRQSSGVKAALVPLSPTKMLVVESRKNEGLDVLPANHEGVLVYTVDMTLPTLKGGYRVVPRPGATDTSQFRDAALRPGNSITTDGVTVSVDSLDTTGDTVKVQLASAAATGNLTVLRAGNGYGTVTSSPAGIDCTPKCFADFPPGATVTLTASAGSGQTFTGWSGDCTGTGACSVSVSGAKNVVANFRGATAPLAGNYQALWWSSPANSESGWGVNLAHQGDIVFGTWFTYDTDGSPMWLVMSAGRITGPDTYSGALYRTTGPVFSANPFNPAQVNATQVGTASFSFADATTGAFKAVVNGRAIVKRITPQQFATPMPTCTADTGTGPSATNFQDLWWNPNESGWGVNITHQGDVVFATWFTYGATGKNQWLVMSEGRRTTGNVFTGKLYRTSGPAYNNEPWDGSVGVAEVGSGTFTFTNAAAGSFTYTVDGVTQTKAITRQVFTLPATVCR